MGINRDHGYSRATDPDTAPCSSSGPDDDLALGGFYCVGLAAAQPSGTKKAPGGGPDPGNRWLPTFLLGVFVWVVIQNFPTSEFPTTLKHPAKLWFMHCVGQYLISLGKILENLRICALPRFLQCAQSLLPLKKDPNVLVIDMHFGAVPVRLLKPKELSPKLRRGIIFYHGGAGLFGSLDCYHGLCSFLASETDSAVLMVGYRKLPSHHHPVLFNDCLSATIYFLKNLESFGVDPSRVVLCGESIGGSAVVTVIQVLTSIPSLPQIRAQVLIYPLVNFVNFQLPSHQQSKNVPFLTRDMLFMCLCKYLAIDLSRKDAILAGAIIPLDKWKKYKKWLSHDNIPRRFWSQDIQLESFGPFDEAAYLETQHVWSLEISPVLADDKIISQFPQTLLVSCENDILRDDALLYKKRLEDQGVLVNWYHVEDGFHGCTILFDKKCLSFPCSKKVVNAVIVYIKGI
ncbi:arylacetamide deacetylase-like 4 [Microtus oregoni]|uniref:arylacetamide deacetylase-like 4 n=1 Tax=Microtus oregoni TaxID=111838 RepID=UPI001BB29E02|nr:arylacetamide deacetylase-like 4 [Microtus oregoni]